MLDFPIYVYIIVIFLIILCLIWFYVTFDILPDQEELLRQQLIKDTIQWLYRSVNDICHNCNMSPLYEIKESFHITYSEKITNTVKGTIYLVLWDFTHNRIFTRNTLIYAVLHEISHILSPSIHHNDPFDSIESLLLNKATELSYYDPNIPIESNYLTLDL